MNRWDNLSMKDKAKYIKFGVDNGITSLDEIRNVYNKYSNGGDLNIKESKNDSWKPWYWFTPKYEGESLKDALFKAYDDGLEGKDILYKGRAYKVKLSPEDYKKYINSGSNTIQTKRFERVLDNDSKTSLKSMEMENDINRRQQKLMDLAISKGHNSEDYYIPYIYDKEIKVKGVGRFSTNMLDSIAVNAKRANIPLSDAIGLAAEETKMGAIPNYSLEANKKRYKEKYGVEMPKDVQKELERTALNSSVARNFGGIQPQFLVNNHEWATRGWEDSSKYKYLAKIKSPLEHAFTLFKNGLYNTGDKNHTDKIKKKGKEIIATKEVQNWLKDYTK